MDVDKDDIEEYIHVDDNLPTSAKLTDEEIIAQVTGSIEPEEEEEEEEDQ